MLVCGYRKKISRNNSSSFPKQYFRAGSSAGDWDSWRLPDFFRFDGGGVYTRLLGADFRFNWPETLGEGEGETLARLRRRFADSSGDSESVERRRRRLLRCIVKS